MAACGGDGDKKAAPPKTPATPAATPSPPQPTFTPQQVSAALIKPDEVGKDFDQSSVGLLSLKEGKLPMCSLSSVPVPGKPRTGTRQFSTPTSSGKSGKYYAQAVAIYANPSEATDAFEKIGKAASACPEKQHVEQKKVPNSRAILLEHDDTWKLTQDNVAQWSHIRGFEKHVEPATQTKVNQFFFVYDYAVRGNVVITSLYWERGEPSQPGDPTAKKATDILTKQLQKIG